MSRIQDKDQLITNSLLSLNDLMNQLNSKHFYKLLLQAVIDIIPSADGGFLFVYDENMNKLLVETAIGYDPLSYRKTQIAPGESITGHVYESKQIHVLNGQMSIKQAMETMTDQNKKYYEASLLTPTYPYATLSFPIVKEDRVLAVFTINGFQQHSYFDLIIKDVLSAISPYITIIYEHYILKEKNKKTRAELEITYKALRKEHTQLQRTTDLYNELASLISQNKSIKELMHAIFVSTQKPIVLYDELLYPMATYGTDESYRLPENFLSLREVQYAISVKKWQLIRGNGESLLVIPVIGLETVIGFLCAWIEEASFNDGDRLLLEYSASMLGLELMKKRTIEETNRMLIGDVFEQLISGNYNEDVLEQAKNLDLRETDFYAILVCEGKEKVEGLNQYFLKDSWINWIQKAMKLAKMDGLVTQRGKDIIAFLTVSKEKDRKIVRNRLKDFTKALEKNPIDVSIGIGRVYQGFYNVQKSYSDAKQCIEILAKKKSSRNVLRFSDSGIYRLLLDLNQEELDLYVHDHLGRLLEEETKKDKELIQTLLVYVLENRDLTKVTNKLSIHHNTLYYRINKIENILQVDLSNFEEWLNISIACKIYQFLYE